MLRAESLVSRLIYSKAKGDGYAYVLIVVIYCISWLFLLLDYDGLYWDDWVLAGQSAETIHKLFDMAGSPIAGASHQFFLSLGNGIWPFKLVTFVSYLVVALCCYCLARNTGRIHYGTALIFAMVVATLPVNQARIAMINTPSAYSLAFFFLAFFLMNQDSGRYRIVCRLLALLLFAASFFIMSLLVFYAVPLLYLIFRDKHQWWGRGIAVSLKNLCNWLVHKLDYILLPFFFLSLKSNYFRPEGIYKGQNDFSISTIASALERTIILLDDVSLAPFERMANGMSMLPIVGIFVATCCYYFFTGRKLTYKSFFLLFALGIVLEYLALFPYVVVNKLPLMSDWESRHQLLLPFGIAMLLASFVELFSAKRPIIIVAAVMLTVFATQNTKDMLSFHRDWLKQQTIIRALEGIPKIREAKNQIVEFDDEAPDLNAQHRVYRFYEFNGWLTRAFGDASRFGVYSGNSSKVKDLLYLKEYSQYNFAHYEGRGAKTIGIVLIKRNSEIAFERIDQQLMIVFSKYFNPDHYRKMGKLLITYEFQAAS